MEYRQLLEFGLFLHPRAWEFVGRGIASLTPAACEKRLSLAHPCFWNVAKGCWVGISVDVHAMIRGRGIWVFDMHFDIDDCGDDMYRG